MGDQKLGDDDKTPTIGLRRNRRRIGPDLKELGASLATVDRYLQAAAELVDDIDGKAREDLLEHIEKDLHGISGIAEEASRKVWEEIVTTRLIQRFGTNGAR